MSDPTLAPLRAARPKSAEFVDEAAAATSRPVPLTKSEQLTEPKRGPGRPPKIDPLTAMQTIASNLRHFDSDERRKILETLLALT